MAKKIFNPQYGIDIPTLLLQNRNFETIGSIDNAHNIMFKDNLNGSNELSFTVYQTINGNQNPLWDSIMDCKIIYIPEFEERFEITTSINSSDSTMKSVTAASLCESELSQTMLYDIEINTETDILNADYDENFPTVFYRDPEDFHNYDWSANKYRNYTDDKKRAVIKRASLLHRILEKAEHYTIGTVDHSLMNMIREFSISHTDLYSELTGEIAEEFNCIFIFDSMTRTISAYDLYNTCKKCGYRGDFSDQCPECGSLEFSGQYGNDTTVFISNENLAQEISLESNKDSLKNCFYVEGGDDIITSTIRSINPNGTNYIYEYNENMKADMPTELSATIKAYDKLYQEYYAKKTFPLDSVAVGNYNHVVKEINQLFKEDSSINFSELCQNLTGYSSVVEAIYGATDLYQFLKNSMMPAIRIDGLGLEESLNNIVTGFLEGFSVINDDGSITKYFQNQIALMNYKTAMQLSVENAIKKSARLYYSRAYYDLEIHTLSYVQATNSTDGIWKGTFTLTSLTEKDDNGISLSKTSDIITLTINDNVELYVEQSIYREIAGIDESKYGEVTSLQMDFDTFKSRISLYSSSELERLKESFQACLNIIITADFFEEDLHNKYYNFYRDRFNYIDTEELPKRLRQLQYIQELYSFDSSTYETSGILYDIKNKVNRILDFKKYVISNPLCYDSYDGERLWKTFCAYRREDKYTNSNYISDGLTNAEIIEKAKLLLDVAKKELYKAANLQLTLSANIHNLLILEEFQPLADSFSCGNWIRIGIDDCIYKLRLLSYQINFDDIPSIEAEFSTVQKLWSGDSDVKSILDSAKSIASSYSYTMQQANHSAKATKHIDHWIEKGMEAAATKIVNSADNQDIVIDRNGILCRFYDDINDIYDPCQTKIISNGLYTTIDGWKTISAGIGKIYYTDPETGEEVLDYGIIAKTVIGKLFLGEQLRIYGANNSIILDESGITLDGGAITWTSNIPNKYIEGFADFQTSVNDDLSILNTAVPVTKIDGNYIISPKIGGGYLYISNAETGISAEINPLNISFDRRNYNYVFSISKNNIPIMGVNSDGEGYFDGKIIAGPGSKIGNLSVGDNKLTYGFFGIDTSSTKPENIALWLGDANPSSASFRVTYDGKLYAKDGNFIGNIETTGGKIGGFTIDDNAIYNNTFGTSGSVMMSTGSTTAKSIGGSDIINGWAFTAGNSFGVTKTGGLYATSGKIGGFTIGSSAIYNGTASITSTTAGIYLGTNGIRQYNSANAYVNIQNGILTARGANLVQGVFSFLDDTGLECGEIRIATSRDFPTLGIVITGNNVEVSGSRLLRLYGGASVDISGSDINLKATTYVTGDITANHVYSASLSGDPSLHCIVTNPGSNPRRIAHINCNYNDGKYNAIIMGEWGIANAWTSYTCSFASSDIRLKENIRDSEIAAMPTINQIKMRQFDWRQDGCHQKIGVVADELEKIDEHFIIGGGYDEEGHIITKSVDTLYLLGYVVKGMQEQYGLHSEKDKAIQTLKRENTKLKTQINSMKKQIDLILKHLEAVG